MCNGVDWRALVESRPPNFGKLRGKHFFLSFFQLRSTAQAEFLNVAVAQPTAETGQFINTGTAGALTLPTLTALPTLLSGALTLPLRAVWAITLSLGTV